MFDFSHMFYIYFRMFLISVFLSITGEMLIELCKQLDEVLYYSHESSRCLENTVKQNIVFNNCPLLFVIALKKHLRNKTGR